MVINTPKYAYVGKFSTVFYVFGWSWDIWRCQKCDLEVNYESDIARNGN